ncbi:hypothetical protein PanWU01x14_011650 [Parasponia andersonii]|uniref:Uncharacterized protein n=1 Tax=Parasponia andersonii TaxID=3476 RepID=A0A2P5E1L0_PARAD|nr:hypothetical protein PanWU01x14_011650 [Parasponia andersonii]
MDIDGEAIEGTRGALFDSTCWQSVKIMRQTKIRQSTRLGWLSWSTSNPKLIDFGHYRKLRFNKIFCFVRTGIPMAKRHGSKPSFENLQLILMKFKVHFKAGGGFLLHKVKIDIACNITFVTSAGEVCPQNCAPAEG